MGIHVDINLAEVGVIEPPVRRIFVLQMRQDELNEGLKVAIHSRPLPLHLVEESGMQKLVFKGGNDPNVHRLLTLINYNPFSTFRRDA